MFPFCSCDATHPLTLLASRERCPSRLSLGLPQPYCPPAPTGAPRPWRPFSLTPPPRSRIVALARLDPAYAAVGAQLLLPEGGAGLEVVHQEGGGVEGGLAVGGGRHHQHDIVARP